MAILIDGYSDADKVPQFVGETKFGAGAILAGSATKTLLLVGLKKSGGTATADQDIVDIFSEDDGRLYFDEGSELANMCIAALKQRNGGYRIKAAAVAAAGGAASATATITIANAATSAGVLRYFIGGKLVDVNIASGTSANDIATAIVARAGQIRDLPILSIAAVGAVVTVTLPAGVRGNQLILAQDLSDGPGATTSTLGGPGSSINANMHRFGGGSGVETLTTILGLLLGERYDYCAFAQNDATSLAAWESHIDAKAGPLEGKMQHVVVGSVDTLVNATSIAQTTLNNQRFQLVWLENGETPASEAASAMAAERAALEGSQPNRGYDGLVLKGVRAQRLKSDVPNRNELQTALDSGITPLLSLADGTVSVVRAITTRSLDGATPDYRTLDTAEAVVPDAVRDRLKLVWTTEYLAANPYVKPDPADGEPDPPPGVATPSGWNARTQIELLAMQEDQWITQVELNAPRAEWNAAGKRIMQAVPVAVLPLQHAIGVSVQQVNVTG